MAFFFRLGELLNLTGTITNLSDFVALNRRFWLFDGKCGIGCGKKEKQGARGGGLDVEKFASPEICPIFFDLRGFLLESGTSYPPMPFERLKTAYFASGGLRFNPDGEFMIIVLHKRL